jgi:hypothetical protein
MQACKNCHDDVFREYNPENHHLCKKQEEYHSPYVDYIVFSMSDSLDDQTAHAKVFSSHLYEKKN